MTVVFPGENYLNMTPFGKTENYKDFFEIRGCTHQLMFSHVYDVFNISRYRFILNSAWCIEGTGNSTYFFFILRWPS